MLAKLALEKLTKQEEKREEKLFTEAEKSEKIRMEAEIKQKKQDAAFWEAKLAKSRKEKVVVVEEEPSQRPTESVEMEDVSSMRSSGPMQETNTDELPKINEEAIRTPSMEISEGEREESFASQNPVEKFDLFAIEEFPVELPDKALEQLAELDSDSNFERVVKQMALKDGLNGPRIPLFLLRTMEYVQEIQSKEDIDKLKKFVTTSSHVDNFPPFYVQPYNKHGTRALVIEEDLESLDAFWRLRDVEFRNVVAGTQ